MTGVQCQAMCWKALLELEYDQRKVLLQTGQGAPMHTDKNTPPSQVFLNQSCFSPPKIKLTGTCHLVENNLADAIRL